MGKRGRSEQVSVQDAREAWKVICQLYAGHIFLQTEVTPIPYLGIGTASGRPPVDLKYVGTEDAFDLAAVVDTVPKLVIFGPRGFGKTSDLRAVVCAMYNEIFHGDMPDRLVGIWNMAAVLDDVVSAVRNAILFTYLMPSKEAVEAAEVAGQMPAESLEAAEVAGQTPAESSKVAALSEAGTQPVEGLAVEEEILRIASISDAIQFIKRRKDMHKEVFRFFVDSWELLDEADSLATPQTRSHHREWVQNQLLRLFAEGEQVWFSASAKSNMVRKEKCKDLHLLMKSKPFNSTQYASYSAHSILERLSIVRKEDILEYTGLVPMFLDVLCECCHDFRRRKAADEKMKLIQQLGVLRRVKWKKVPAMLSDAQKAAIADDNQLVKLLEDDENWQLVLKIFREHEAVKQVHENARKIVLDAPCYSMEEMGKKDTTYFNLEENEYCSRYVHRIYVEEFRRKEALIPCHAGGAWLPYCKYLIAQSNVNWSDVGWVVEGLLGDVVTNRKVYMGKHVGNLAGLRLEQFKEISSLRIAMLQTIKPGSGYYYKPDLFNFSYVDGVIIYRDMQGKLHIIGLQVTVKVDEHLASALLFMSFQYLKIWFPDLDTTNYQNDVQLHFVFVGCSKKHSEEFSDDQDEQVKKLRGGKSCGIAGHKWSFIPLAKALECLNSEEVDVVEAVVAARKLQAIDVKLSLAALMQLKRKELDEVAQNYGVDPAQFSRKEDLLNALENLI